MAQVTYTDGIRSVRGALDSVKVGQAKRARWMYTEIYRGMRKVAS